MIVARTSGSMPSAFAVDTMPDWRSIGASPVSKTVERRAAI
jgi:hypothetical protein